MTVKYLSIPSLQNLVIMKAMQRAAAQKRSYPTPYPGALGDLQRLGLVQQKADRMRGETRRSVKTYELTLGGMQLISAVEFFAKNFPDAVKQGWPGAARAKLLMALYRSTGQLSCLEVMKAMRLGKRNSRDNLHRAKVDGLITYRQARRGYSEDWSMKCALTPLGKALASLQHTSATILARSKPIPKPKETKLPVPTRSEAKVLAVILFAAKSLSTPEIARTLKRVPAQIQTYLARLQEKGYLYRTLQPGPRHGTNIAIWYPTVRATTLHLRDL